MGQVIGFFPTGRAGGGCHTLASYGHDFYAVTDIASIKTVLYREHGTVATVATWGSFVVPLGY